MDPAEWNEMLADFQTPHVLQTWEWGKFKETVGWKMIPQVWRDEDGNPRALAMVLQRSLRLGGLSTGLNVLYVPRGPVMDWADARLRQRVLGDLKRLAHAKKAIEIKIDPELVLGKGVPGAENSEESMIGQASIADLEAWGWRYSDEQVQFKNTVWLDLGGGEGDWPRRMKQKARYNLRLAQRKGVKVRPGSRQDLPMLYQMYRETAERDGFIIRPEEYYLNLWSQFMETRMAFPLIAEVNGEPVAGLVLFLFDRRAWYLYGMSTGKYREWMPNHLLQWEAMRTAYELDCDQYDLWGAPDHFDETDSMWGVYRFKDGLGGEVVRTAGAWDYAPNPLLYGMYKRVMPRILAFMRSRNSTD